MLLQLILREKPNSLLFAGRVSALEGTLMKSSVLISFHLRAKAYPGERAHRTIAFEYPNAVKSLHDDLVI